jgi:hypothetical protein
MKDLTSSGEIELRYLKEEGIKALTLQYRRWHQTGRNTSKGFWGFWADVPIVHEESSDFDK